MATDFYKNKKEYVFFIFINGVIENYIRKPHYLALSEYGETYIIPQVFSIKSFFKGERIHNCKYTLKKYKYPINILSQKIGLPKFFRRLYIIDKFCMYRNFNRIKKLALDFKKSGREVIIIQHDNILGKVPKNILNKFVICFELTDAPWYFNQFKLRKRIKRINEISEGILTSDIIFCTSKMLTDFANHLNPNSYFIPNTCEIPDMKSLKLGKIGRKNKVLGFLGNINDWLDIDLIEKLAYHIKNHKIIFVGRINGSRNFNKRFLELVNLNKIEYKKSVPQNEIFNIINSFDVCLIPYKKDHFKKYVHPNKLYQYLSLGKPVVTTDFCPDLEDIKDLIYIAKNINDFANKCQQALNENNPYIREKRINFAKSNSVVNRAYMRIKIISEYLRKGT